MKTKVTLIESQKEVSDRIIGTLSGAADIELCADYNSTEAAMRNVKSDYSDVYLIDINCIDFLQHVSKINKKATFIINSNSTSIKDLIHSFAAGATGYIIKDCAEEELIEGIKVIASGEFLTNLSTAKCILSKFKEFIQNQQRLTKTEIDVLQKLHDGASYEEIAAQRNVCLSTVQSHIKKIYKKFNVNNKKDAITQGTLFGLIETNTENRKQSTKRIAKK